MSYYQELKARKQYEQDYKLMLVENAHKEKIEQLEHLEIVQGTHELTVKIGNYAIVIEARPGFVHKGIEMCDKVVATVSKFDGFSGEFLEVAHIYNVIELEGGVKNGND